MWITITNADLKSRLSATEYSAITNAARAQGQTAEAIVAEVIGDLTKFVRGKVASCARNVLGAGATIPDELKDAFLAVVRFRILTRLPDVGLLDENRRAEYRDAMSAFDDAANCKIEIAPALDPVTTPQSGSTVEVIHSTRRDFTRSSLSGL